MRRSTLSDNLLQVGAEEDGYISLDLDDAEDDPHRGSTPRWHKPKRRSPGPLDMTTHSRSGSRHPSDDPSTTPSTPAPRTPTSSDVCLGTGEFCLSEVRVFAQQITLLDFEAYAKIRPEELSELGFSKKDKAHRSPNACAFAQRFNQLSYWLVDEILRHETSHDRAKAISVGIKLAKVLREMNNLHGTLAVVAALRMAPIHRLKKSWSGVESKRRKQYEAIKMFMSEENNYDQLRAHVATCKPPCIPFLGVYKRDLIHLEVAEGEDAGCRQHQVEQIVADVLKFQDTPYTFHPHPAILDSLLAEEFPSTDDKEAIKSLENRADKRSQDLEPKEKPKTLPFPPGRRGALIPQPQRVTRDDYALAPRPPTKRGHRKAKSLGNSLAFPPECLLARSDGIFSGSIDALDGAATASQQSDQKFDFSTPLAYNASNKLPPIPHRATTPTILVTNDEGPNSVFDADADSSASDDDVPETTFPPDIRSVSGHAAVSHMAEADADAAAAPSTPKSQQGLHGKEFLFQGPLLRNRGGLLSSYKRYWVGLTRAHLVFYARKDAKAVGRLAYSAKMLKMKSIFGAVLMIGDVDLDRKFALRLLSGKMLQFKAETSKARGEWLVALRACLGISVADVVQMDTSISPPVRRRYFGSRAKKSSMLPPPRSIFSPSRTTVDMPETVPEGDRSNGVLSSRGQPASPKGSKRQSPKMRPKAEGLSAREMKASPKTRRRGKAGKGPAPVANGALRDGTGGEDGPAAAEAAPAPSRGEGPATVAPRPASVPSLATGSAYDLGTVAHGPVRVRLKGDSGSAAGAVKANGSCAASDSRDILRSTSDSENWGFDAEDSQGSKLTGHGT